MAKKVTPTKSTKTKPAKPKTAPAQSKGATWTLDETLRQLESLGDAGVRVQNAKSGPLGRGCGDNQFGVRRGDVRKLADKIKTNHELALALWETGNVDAQFLATKRRTGGAQSPIDTPSWSYARSSVLLLLMTRCVRPCFVFPHGFPLC